MHFDRTCLTPTCAQKMIQFMLRLLVIYEQQFDFLVSCRHIRWAARTRKMIDYITNESLGIMYYYTYNPLICSVLDWNCYWISSFTLNIEFLHCNFRYQSSTFRSYSEQKDEMNIKMSQTDIFSGGGSWYRIVLSLGGWKFNWYYSLQTVTEPTKCVK